MGNFVSSLQFAVENVIKEAIRVRNEWGKTQWHGCVCDTHGATAQLSASISAHLLHYSAHLQYLELFIKTIHN